MACRLLPAYSAAGFFRLAPEPFAPEHSGTAICSDLYPARLRYGHDTSKAAVMP